MKRYTGLFLALVSFVIFLSVSSFSQEVTELKTDGSDNMNENFNQAEKPDDSYLAKFHAQVVVDKLIKRNLEQIYMLNVIVTNYSKHNWKGDYDNIYAEYKRAIELYYKRDMIFSRVWLERNQKSISDLMKKMAEQRLAIQKENLSRLVSAGQITQAQADAKIAWMQKRIDAG
ncbi:MAG TPA: DUF2680 domain-containing protein, partial [Spirochaetota bacterium]|nr:DUF2680 domain-containing protein [Spirochaetota bacterium]